MTPETRKKCEASVVKFYNTSEEERGKIKKITKTTKTTKTMKTTETRKDEGRKHGKMNIE